MRPPQLDDADWLANRYARDGDRVIARELGCSHATVTAARRRLGIAPMPEGRRRRSPIGDSSHEPIDQTTSLPALLERFTEDQRTHAPATRHLLIARCRGWLDAERHHDQLAIEDALLSIASASLLVHQHRIKLRTDHSHLASVS